MRRFCLLILTVICLTAILSGCACTHEWTEPDCVNGAVCKKCEETGEAALGHDWTPATCALPETCSRCGQVQGYPLEHSFGDWVVSGSARIRACGLCGAEESEELAPEEMVALLLPGHWDYLGSCLMGQEYTAEDLGYFSIGEAITVREDYTATYYSARNQMDVVLEYTGFEQTPEGDRYALKMKTPYGQEFDMALLQQNRENILYFYYTPESYTRMQKNDQLAGVLSGTWAATENGQMYTLNLSQDRTFTADFNGEISGSWHLTNVNEENGYRSASLQLNFTQNRIPCALKSTLSLGATEKETEERLQQTGIYLRPNGTEGLKLLKADDVRLEELNAALEEGPRKLIGTWISEKIFVTPADGGERTERETEDYSFVFREDGTFTGAFDREYTGTWEYSELRPDRTELRYYSTPQYVYKIQFEGSSRSSEVYLTGNGRISVFASDDTRSMSAWFIQTADDGTDHAAAAPELILGSWHAVELFRTTDQGHQLEEADPDVHNLTVSPDGTFTLNLGTQVTGTWHFSEYTFNSGYCYVFTPEGADGSWGYTMDTPGLLKVFVDKDGLDYQALMEKEG